MGSSINYNREIRVSILNLFTKFQFTGHFQLATYVHMQSCLLSSNSLSPPLAPDNSSDFCISYVRVHFQLATQEERVDNSLFFSFSSQPESIIILSSLFTIIIVQNFLISHITLSFSWFRDHSLFYQPVASRILLEYKYVILLLYLESFFF